MNTNPYHQLYRRCLIASVLCYILSFIFPVFSTSNLHLNFMQGVWMFMFGWIALDNILFLTWADNIIFIILLITSKVKYKKKGSSLCARVFAYFAILFGAIFPIYGKIIEDEGGGWHEIKAIHFGYWLWEASMVLLAISLMAKSKEGSLAHRIVDYYIAKRDGLTPLMKLTIAIIFVLLVICIAIITLSPLRPR